jgi:hypothetical protein
MPTVSRMTVPFVGTVIRKIRRSLERDGVIGTIKLCIRNLYSRTRKETPSDFDVRYGVDTDARVELGDLQIDSPSRKWGVVYAATPVGVFELMMDALRNDYSLDPRNYSFIDLGSGKGRIVLMASQKPFRAVMGVEFSRELCDVAEANLCKFRPHVVASDVRTVREDAAQFLFPPGPLIVYCYNPFGVPILAAVMKRLADRREETIFVYYGDSSVQKQSILCCEAALREFHVIHRSGGLRIWVRSTSRATPGLAATQK